MDDIIGHKIVDIIRLPQEVADKLMWNDRPICLLLDNGLILFPSRDEESNEAGCFFGNYKDGSGFILG
jgi:hypothetical protein